MELLQIKRTEFNLGLKKEYKFFQISDMHISYCDELSSPLDISDKERCDIQWNKGKIQFAKDNDEFYDERYDIDSIVLLETLFSHAKMNLNWPDLWLNFPSQLLSQLLLKCLFITFVLLLWVDF